MAFVQRQNTGGWATAHELAHQLGAQHLLAVGGRGYWVQRRALVDALDFMHPSTAGADVRSPTSRWIAGKTYDLLAGRLEIGAPDPPTIAISGSVGADGHVDAGPWYELDGVVDAGGDEYRVRLRDAAGAVLGTAGFDATHRAAADLRPRAGGAARVRPRSRSACSPWGTRRRSSFCTATT